jgi:hypothetical protein
MRNLIKLVIKLNFEYDDLVVGEFIEWFLTIKQVKYLMNLFTRTYKSTYTILGCHWTAFLFKLN